MVPMSSYESPPRPDIQLRIAAGLEIRFLADHLG